MINSDGQVVGTGQTREIAAQLVVRSVGYRGQPLPGVPYDESTGRVPHAEGRVIRDGTFSADEYVTGWIKRGPTGVIGTNKSDAVETVTALLTDVDDGAVRAHGRVGDLDRLLARRGHPRPGHAGLAPDRRGRDRARAQPRTIAYDLGPPAGIAGRCRG